MFNALNQRSESKSLFAVGLFRNHWLWLAIIISVCMQFIVVSVPFFQSLFGTVALSAMDWLVAAAVSASVLVFGEFVKLLRR
jgi:magnesium-transporting ATPase (P-type)